MKRVVLSVVAVLASVFSLVSAEKINFQVHPLLTAGKVSLTEKGYVVPRTLDTVNFSPEVRMPIQLIYRSAAEKTDEVEYSPRHRPHSRPLSRSLRRRWRKEPVGCAPASGQTAFYRNRWGPASGYCSFATPHPRRRQR